MEAALGAGARLVNDVSALTFDPRSAEVVAAAGVPVVLMHHQGAPEIDAGRAALRRRAGRGLSVARGADRGGRGGGDRSREDPRRSRHRLRQVGRAQSRADERAGAVPRARLPDRARARAASGPSARCRTRRRPTSGSAAAWRWRSKAADQGAQIIRAHDVFETVQALRVWRGLRDQALTPRVLRPRCRCRVRPICGRASSGRCPGGGRLRSCARDNGRWRGG